METKNLINGSLALTAFVAAITFAGCATRPDVQCCRGDSIGGKLFGCMPDGATVKIYTLRNKNDMEAKILNYGGIIQSLKVPDRNGKLGDVVLGYDDLGDYRTNSPYFGAMIGRYGNRIALGRFTLDGVSYQLATNNCPNSLHGGVVGFDKRIWSAMPGHSAQSQTLTLTYMSHDGEEGYPANLNVTAVYTLMADQNELRLDFTATCDRDTIINLTAHSYFNLAGHGDILGHVVQIDADKFTPVDATSIPTGAIEPVAGTPFDFRTPTPIGARINEDNQQLKNVGGYDHNWGVNHPMGELAMDARVTEPTTGRVLEIWSTEPGLQFYSGNFLNGSMTGKYGHVYQFRDAYVMEPQHYPDSPNHPNFSTTELKPGQVYHNTIIYKFMTEQVATIHR